MSLSFASPRLASAPVYAPPTHLAPADLDLSGASSFGSCETFRYPDARALEAVLAERWGVTPAQVIVTAGADDALDRACRATLSERRSAVITDPTFEMIPRYVALAGAELREVAWPSGSFPSEACVAAADASTSLVVIVSPNNPTGATATVDEVRRVHDALPGVLVVVDLAYAEFADSDPTRELLALPRVLVVRTFSKAWAAPDARVGFALGAREVIALLRRAGGPFPVSSGSIELARALLATRERQMLARVAAVRINRDRIESVLRECGAPATRSEGNFACATGPRAPWLRDALGGLGIATRLLESAGQSRLRITVPPEEAVAARLADGIAAALTPQAILFDLDGVIADVTRSYREAIMEAAKRLGASVTPEAIGARKAAGNANDDWALTADLVRDAGVACSLEEATATFEPVYQGTDGNAGLRELESLLVNADWIHRLALRLPLAIVTGRPRVDAERFLARFGLGSAFAAVVTREDAPLKPSAEPVREALRRLGVKRAWMIGDTPDDLVSARAAGVVPIGIASRDQELMRRSLWRAGAARIAENAMEVESWLS